MYLLGLTGSIGMGKSTTARLFAEEGCAVWDADAAVHRLYAKGGAAVAPMAAAFPTAITGEEVSRPALKAIIAEDPTALERIEAIVHPLVGQDRVEFLRSAKSDIAVLDIPLLFETGGDARMDGTVCVTVPEAEQRRRVLERGTMTDAQFEAILAKQMPSAEKCARADFVVETDTLDHARAEVRSIVAQIRKNIANA